MNLKEGVSVGVKHYTQRNNDNSSVSSIHNYNRDLVKGPLRYLKSAFKALQPCLNVVCDILLSFRFPCEYYYIEYTVQLWAATAFVKDHIRSLFLISNGKASHKSIGECTILK